MHQAPQPNLREHVTLEQVLGGDFDPNLEQEGNGCNKYMYHIER